MTVDNIGGKKSITCAGSVFLLINTSVGAGVALLPALYQQCGWVLSIIITCLLSSLTYQIGLILAESIRMIPNNKNFDLRIEYIYLIKYYCQPLKNRYQSRRQNANTPLRHATTNDETYYNDTNNNSDNYDNNDSNNSGNDLEGSNYSTSMNEGTSIVGDIQPRYYHSPPLKTTEDKHRKLSILPTSKTHILSIVAQ